MKIKRDGDEWRFTWSQGNEVYTLKANERPLPELPAALDGLIQYAVDAAAFIDKKYHPKTVVSGIDFDWKGDDNRRNAVVILSIDCGQHGFVKVPTPKKLADNNLDEKRKGRWDTNAVAQFDKVQEEAFGYIDGERSQQSMPLMEKGKKEKKGKTDARQTNLDNELDTPQGRA